MLLFVVGILVLGIEVFDKYVTEAALNIKLDQNITSLCSHSVITYRVLPAQHGFQSHPQQSEYKMDTKAGRYISSNKQLSSFII